MPRHKARGRKSLYNLLYIRVSSYVSGTKTPTIQRGFGVSLKFPVHGTGLGEYPERTIAGHTQLNGGIDEVPG